MLGYDEGYFFLNPAALQKLQPQIWGDLTTTDAGLLLNFGNKVNAYLVAGLPITQNFTGIPVTTPVMSPLANQLAQVGVGFAVGNIDIGVSAFTGFKSYTDANNNNSDFVVGANGGAIIPFGQNLSLDAAGGVTFWSIQRHPVPTNDYVATPLDFSALARLNWVLAQNNTLHIYGRFAYTNRGYSLAGTNTAVSNIDLVAGASDEMTITEGVLIFAGAYLDASSTSTTTVAGTYTIVGNAGGELSLSKEVVARLGLAENFEVINTNTATNVTTVGGTSTALSGGVGLNFGNLTFDAEADVALFTDGPNFISGANTAPWTLELSATYYFAKAAK
jgi:hypothetical protein